MQIVISRLRVGLACAIAAPILAQDPPMPPGGFPVAEQLNQLLTYSDGYRTRYDLRLPDPAQVTPPASGWPFLLLVHGFSGARGAFTLNGEGVAYAQRGYITVAYDVRGQGEARGLNPGRGTSLGGGLEKADMAELFHILEARLGSTMDFGRLAVMGTSQGGAHSWSAAAFSEQPLPQPRGTITTFPKVLAVCPRAGTPNSAALWNPDGNAFGGNQVNVWFNTNAVLEPSVEATLQQLFSNQDFAGLTAFLANDPWRQERTLVTRSKVAVLQQYSWDDFALGEISTLDALASMPAGTPRFAHLSTGLHQTPFNQLEADLGTALTERWLDHFLKGAPDEIAQQPSTSMAAVPAAAAVATNPASVWPSRQAPTWPDTGLTAPMRMYLRQGQALSTAPPSGSEPADRIVHNVAAGFGPAAWVKTKNSTEAVFAAVPLSSVVYRGPVLGTAVEILGRATAHLELDSPAPNLQVGLALFDEDPSGQRRYLSGGFRCLRGRTKGTNSYDLEFRGTDTVIPAGHRIAVAVENHVWHRPLGISHLQTVPFFESYVFDCRHEAGAESWIELPATTPLLSTRAAATTLSRGSNGNLVLVVDGSPRRGGQTYAVLPGLSGTVPGFQLFGVHVPLNLDPWTSLALQVPTTPPFLGFVGVLDAAGTATARFTPAANLLPQGLLGARLSFAGATLEPAGGLSASAPSQVRIDP